MSKTNGLVFKKIEELDADENTKNIMKDLFRSQRDAMNGTSNTYLQNRFKEIIERSMR